MRDMVPMTLDDFDAAPFRFAASAVFPCSAERLFQELGDPPRWTKWFPLMLRARWTSRETRRAGAQREVFILGFGHFRETILAFDEGARFSFTMIASTSPLADRMAEDYRVTAVDGAARLDWTLVAHLSRWGKIVERGLPLILSTIWRGAGIRLRRRLRG